MCNLVIAYAYYKTAFCIIFKILQIKTTNIYYDFINKKHSIKIGVQKYAVGSNKIIVLFILILPVRSRKKSDLGGS